MDLIEILGKLRVAWILVNWRDTEEINMIGNELCDEKDHEGV